MCSSHINTSTYLYVITLAPVSRKWEGDSERERERERERVMMMMKRRRFWFVLFTADRLYLRRRWLECSCLHPSCWSLPSSWACWRSTYRQQALSLLCLCIRPLTLHRHNCELYSLRCDSYITGLGERREGRRGRGRSLMCTGCSVVSSNTAAHLTELPQYSCLLLNSMILSTLISNVTTCTEACDSFHASLAWANTTPRVNLESVRNSRTVSLRFLSMVR